MMKIMIIMFYGFQLFRCVFVSFCNLDWVKEEHLQHQQCGLKLLGYIKYFLLLLSF